MHVLVFKGYNQLSSLYPGNYSRGRSPVLYCIKFPICQQARKNGFVIFIVGIFYLHATYSLYTPLIVTLPVTLLTNLPPSSFGSPLSG